MPYTSVTVKFRNSASSFPGVRFRHLLNRVDEARSKPVVAFVVKAFDGRLPDGPVHPLDLPLGPWLVSRRSISVASRIMSNRV